MKYFKTVEKASGHKTYKQNESPSKPCIKTYIQESGATIYEWFGGTIVVVTAM